MVEGVQFPPPGAGEVIGAWCVVGKVVDGAGVGLQVAGKDVEQGGLAGAILTPQQDDLALAQFQIQPVQHDLTAESLLQTLCAQQNRPMGWFGRRGALVAGFDVGRAQ